MVSVTRLQLAHTSELDVATLETAQALLRAVFDDLADDDWEHALGGIHALLWDEGELIGHASVVQRRLLHAGRAFRTGYVEGVGVREDRRRRGHGATMLTALERVIRGAYELGALGAADDAIAFYLARGWRRWEGPTSVLTPRGIERTPDDDGAILVLPVSAALDLSGELTCDWRGGDVW